MIKRAKSREELIFEAADWLIGEAAKDEAVRDGILATVRDEMRRNPKKPGMSWVLKVFQGKTDELDSAEVRAARVIIGAQVLLLDELEESGSNNLHH